MSLYGRFDIGDGTMYAYMPDSADDERVWNIEYRVGGKIVHGSTLPMIHDPIFGPDIEDTGNLDRRIEEIITELELE